MSAGRYLEGVVLGLVCVGALAFGARRLRLRLAPSFAGTVAGIADGVTFLALLTLALEAAGVIGVFDRIGVVAGCVLVGGVAWAVGARGPVAPRAVGVSAGRTLSQHRTLVMSVAIAGTSVVAAAWIGWTMFAYRHGMETIDTLWYHMPFAARFVQNREHPPPAVLRRRRDHGLLPGQLRTAARVRDGRCSATTCSRRR